MCVCVCGCGCGCGCVGGCGWVVIPDDKLNTQRIMYLERTTST